MSRDLRTSPIEHTADATVALRFRDLFHWQAAFPPLVAVLIGALLAILVYQIPATHRVDIGGYDSGYVLGFHDPDRASASVMPAYLTGSDGTARWSRSESYLLFPQAGLPAQLTLRLRGHPNQPSTALTILVNGIAADQFRVGADWQERTITVTGGLLKSDDVLVTLQSKVQPLSAEDSRRVGVLLDQATYTTGPPPLLPYPSQVIYAGCAAGLLWLVLAAWLPGRPWRQWSLSIVLLMLVFLFCYRLQPAYPLPLRGLLPQVCVGLAAVLIVRYAPILVRVRSLADWLAIGSITIWVGAMLVFAEQHLVLSVPGVEKDFRVFATRVTLDQIVRADAFYNLGYPFMLWLVRPFAEDNAFLAGRLIAVGAATTLLLTTWWVARRRLGAGSALVALAILGLSPFVVQYTLYLGSDMPFAALCGLQLALLDWVITAPQQATSRRLYWACAAAGLLAGVAFLVRHPGIVLLPVGWVVLLTQRWQVIQGRGLARPAPVVGRQIAICTLACVVAILPQLFVNQRDTGQLFYSQQAKNIWLAVFGDGDWGRWGEAANTITLTEVVLQDPLRMWANVAGNLRAFVGTGAEDSSEFGRAIQLHFLGFPANWLAVAGLLGWLYVLILRRTPSFRPFPLALALWSVVYIPAIAIGFALPRFFLPVVPLYSLAAAWALAQIPGRSGALRAHVGLALILIWLVSGGVSSGATYVLRAADSADGLPGQPAATVAMARLTLDALQPGEHVIVRVPTDDEAGLALAKYSAISHRTVPVPPDDDPKTLRAAGATLLIWSEQLGPPPAVGPVIGQSGPYTLYRID